MKARKKTRIICVILFAIMILTIFGGCSNETEEPTTEISKEPESQPLQIVLPDQYDYRTEGRFSKVKDQGEHGTCWSFASTTALETSLLPQEKLFFSVDHMSLSACIHVEDTKDLYKNGGDFMSAAAYLLSWNGPVLEEDDPYGDGIKEELEAQKHIQEIQLIEPKEYDMIKKMVYLKGGVQSSLYLSLASSKGRSFYYNEDTSAYCYMGNKIPNHDMVIIGWDDHYPAENFTVEVEGDGAFICANSWGKEFGDDGIIYVSYYDTNIGVNNAVYSRIESKDNYDRIYQSDLCGWNASIGYGDEHAFFKNVYIAEEDSILEAVGFYATGPNTSYTIWTAGSDARSVIQKTLQKKGTLENAGFYTISLEHPIELDKEDEFSIIIEVKTPGYRMPVAVELKRDDTCDVVIDDGNGSVSRDGIHWEQTESVHKANVCLKAYTTKRENGD